MPDTAVKCPHCARPLSPGAPEGLCPACLMSSLSELMGEATGDAAAPVPSLAAPHERVGDYELLDELGRGGMGVVFRARDRRLNRDVALKLILTGQLASEAEVKRFGNEAEAAAQLEHPHIVPIYEVGESEGRHFFAMKLVEGGTLAEAIQNAKLEIRNEEPEPRTASRSAPAAADPFFIFHFEFCIPLLVKVARAVHHAHQRGILHRDLKPGNILLDADGEPMVADFGLARRVEGGGTLTLSGAVVGSPSYMAPEQASGGSRAVTTAADIYSLGAILYELLCGQPPFMAATPLETMRKLLEEEPVPPSHLRSSRRKEALIKKSEIRNQKSEIDQSLLTSAATSVDRDLETICLKCLAKDPARRYATAEALAEDLERWLRHEPIHARPSQIWERALKWTKRHPARAGLVAVALLAPAVVIAVLLVMGAKLTHERNLALAQKSTALSEAGRAETNALTARQNSYAADIYLAAQFVEDGRFGPALDLLKNHEPGPGQADVRGFEWRWLRSQCVGDPARVLRGHSNAVHTLAFSADGRRMASGGRDRIHLWDTEKWQETGSFPDPNDHAVWDAKSARWLDLVQREPKKGIELLTGRTGLETEIAPSRPDRADAIWTLAFSPDGRTIVSAGHDAYVKFWDVTAGRLRTWYELWQTHAVFLADGRVATFGEFSARNTESGRNLKLVDPATGKPVQTLASNSITFGASANGRWLATFTDDREVAVWDASNLVVVARFRASDPLLGIPAVSSDGQRVASAVFYGEHVRVYHADKGWRQTNIEGLKAQVNSLVFSPDGQRLALGMRDSTVRLHDTVNGKPLRRFIGHLGEVFAVAWEPGGRLVSAAQDGTIRVWDPAEPPRVVGIPQRFSRFVVSPDSDQFAGILQDERIILWDGRASEPRVLNDRTDFVPLAFRPEESALLVGAGQNTPRPTLELWRLADGTALRTLTVAFGRSRLASPRGDRVVVWRETEAVVYDVANGRELARFQDDRMRFHEERMWTKGFELGDGVFTGGRFIVRTLPFGASVWDVATCRCLSILRTPDGVNTECLTATPDGALVFTGDDDHRIRVWDSRDGRLLRTLTGHSGAIQLLTAAPEGRTLASYGEDRAVKLWSLSTGRELMTLERGKDYSRLLFTPDGQALVAAHLWAGAFVWRANAAGK